MKTQFVLPSVQSYWRYSAAGFSAVAGIIHAYFMSEHFEAWVGYGGFFLVATVCQLLLSHILAATRPVRREVLWAGILGNAAIIALWIVTRTLGIPLGPEAGMVEEIGALDRTSKIAELVVIVCLAVLLREKTELGAHSRLSNS